jgi:hypothetical protein
MIMTGVMVQMHAYCTHLQRTASHHIHAASKNGFIANALLMFKLGTKSADDHHEMDFDNYERWLKIKLISNFLPKFDISSRQCSLPKCTTRSNSNFFIPKKNAMIDWLSDCGIPFSEQMCKPELYSLTNLHNQ